MPSLEFREALRLASALELQLRVPIDLVQLCDLGPGFRLKILLHGLPLVIRDELLYHRLIWASFSELQDFRITLEMARGVGARGQRAPRARGQQPPPRTTRLIADGAHIGLHHQEGGREGF